MKKAVKARAGFSLTELAIVLAVMGIVLGSLWIIVPSVSENSKRKEAAGQVVVVVKNIRDYFAGCSQIATACLSGGTSASAALTSFLIEKNLLLPEQLRNRSSGGVGGYVADNPWTLSSGYPGGGFLVCSGGTGGCAAMDARAEFDVQLLGLSRSSCAAMAADVSGASGPTGLLRVAINGTTAETLPIIREDALTKCNATQNTVHFVFRLRQR